MKHDEIRIIDYLDILDPIRDKDDKTFEKIYESLKEMARRESVLFITPKHRPHDSFADQSITFNDLFVDKRERSTASIELLKSRPSTKAFEFGIIDTEIKIS